MADMMAWALHKAGIRFVTHYLDDFLISVPLSTEVEEYIYMQSLSLDIYTLTGASLKP